MMKVGLPSLFVAVLGVVTPFALGWGGEGELMTEGTDGILARRASGAAESGAWGRR